MAEKRAKSLSLQPEDNVSSRPLVPGILKAISGVNRKIAPGVLAYYQNPGATALV